MIQHASLTLLPWIALAACIRLGHSTSPPRFPSVDAAQAHLMATGECEDCDLSRAELAYAKLAGANLRRANLSGCDLTRADLSHANLEGAKLRRCDFSTATNLSLANLSRTDLTLAAIKGAVLNGTNFCEALMPDGTKGPPCLADAATPRR